MALLTSALKPVFVLYLGLNIAAVIICTVESMVRSLVIEKVFENDIGKYTTINVI